MNRRGFLSILPTLSFVTGCIEHGSAYCGPGPVSLSEAFDRTSEMPRSDDLEEDPSEKPEWIEPLVNYESEEVTVRGHVIQTHEHPTRSSFTMNDCTEQAIVYPGGPDKVATLADSYGVEYESSDRIPEENVCVDVTGVPYYTEDENYGQYKETFSIFPYPRVVETVDPR
jgi:hypothetical protein